MDLTDRITIEADKCGGKPCIRRMRIRVIDVLEMLGAGMTEAEILADFPDLEHEDILASLQFAAKLIDPPQTHDRPPGHVVLLA
jgi:uncharacterized protein (DUF433 family)